MFVKFVNILVERYLIKVDVIFDRNRLASYSVEMFSVPTTKFNRNPLISLGDEARDWTCRLTCVNYPLCLCLVPWTTLYIDLSEYLA